MKHWQDYFISVNQEAVVVQQKPSAAIYRIEGTNIHFVADMAHPGDVYPEEDNLTLTQAKKVYSQK